VKAISIVIPIYNEEDSLEELVRQLVIVLTGLPVSHEIIFVNDGSTDGSKKKLEQICVEFCNIRLINLRRNIGQTAAFMAGLDAALGDVIVTMDGDLQNCPTDIPRMLDNLDEDSDVVCGWRRNRKDSYFSRVLVSRVANLLISLLTGVKLHDYGCSLKVFKKEFVKGIELYGEMHRFLPIFCHWKGARIKEVSVKHLPRKYGKSQYGLSRIYKVILDLFFVKFMMDYSMKPIHFFGKWGGLLMLFGFFSFVFVILRTYLFEGEWLSPLIIISFFFMNVGLMIILIGLIAEILIRVYHRQRPHSYLEIEDQ